MDSSKKRDLMLRLRKYLDEIELSSSSALDPPDPDDNHVLLKQVKDHVSDLTIQARRVRADLVPDDS